MMAPNRRRQRMKAGPAPRAADRARTLADGGRAVIGPATAATFSVP